MADTLKLDPLAKAEALQLFRDLSTRPQLLAWLHFFLNRYYKSTDLVHKIASTHPAFKQFDDVDPEAEPL